MGIAIVIAALILGFSLFIGLTEIADNVRGVRVQLRVLNVQFCEYRLGIVPKCDDPDDDFDNDEPEEDA